MLSTFAVEVLLNTLFGAGTIYLSLHTGDPGESGDNRVAVPMALVKFGKARERGMSNIEVLEFPDMPAARVTHIGLWDGSGHFLDGGALQTPQPVSKGNTFRIGVGDLRKTVV